MEVVEKTKECRFPDCEVTKIRARGFCSKHYQRYRKGIISLDCRVLKMKYPCLREGCKAKLAKPDTYCSDHTTHKSGLCRLCSNTKLLYLRLCTIHYSRYKKGYIDKDGKELKPLTKRRYKPNDQCRMRGCTTKPRGRGLCRRHSDQVRWGMIDERGIRLKDFRYQNKNKVCKAPKCDQPATKRQYCRKHYDRWNNGYLNIEDSPRYRKKHGHGSCCVKNCGQLSIRESYCKKHYIIITEMKLNALKKPAHEYDKNQKICIIKDCNKLVHAKKLCSSCYNLWRRRILALK